MVDRIGFVGTGAMGGGMALCLRKAGFPLTVFDPNPAVLAQLRERGATILDGPSAVADNSEIIFACLPSQKVSHDVAVEVARGRALQLYIETSTIGTVTMAAVAEALKPRGIALLDAPISGGPQAANAGALSTIVSGAAADLGRARAAIDSFASHIFYVGDQPGQAQIAKLINNLLSSAGKVVAFEGMTMAIEAGIDPMLLDQFINVSTGRNMATMDDFPTRLLQLFRSRGKKSIGTKDTELYIEEAKRLGVPVWTAPSVLALHEEGASYGSAPVETLRLTRYVERLTALAAEKAKAK
jgi:3-hydroxyisobutyrate dehydrogenase-like beta-hydroxyacid dehydrogenase